MVEWTNFVIIPVAIALIVAIGPVLDILNQVAFSSIDGNTASYFPNIMKLLLGIIPLTLVLSALYQTLKPNPSQAIN